MSNNHEPVLLVSGASGQLGRRVVELLIEAKAGSIIAGSRTPEKLTDFRAQGVITRRVDFEDVASLAEAFAGVDRLLLISTDVVVESGKRLSQHRAAVTAASAAGVGHVVYTSLINPGPDSPVSIAPDHDGTEKALAASTLGWTILRNNIYLDVQISTLQRAVQTGQLINACGAGKTAYVTREDCARAAAAALAARYAGHQTLDITGPEALSQADLAAITSRVAGKPVTFVPIPPETLTEGLQAAGLPAPIVDLVVSFDLGIAQGRFAAVTDSVEKLTGRGAIRAEDFLTAQRDLLLAAAHGQSQA